MFAFAILLSLILLILGTPIFLVFGLGSSIAAVWGLNLPWSTLIQVSFGAMTKHILIAVPLFIFAGMVMWFNSSSDYGRWDNNDAKND